MIEIDETIELPAGQDKVWAILSNPYEVVGLVADAEILEDNGDGTFDGIMTVKFGPMRVKFNARVQLDLAPETHSGKITAQGKDSQGGTRMRTTAAFVMSPQNEETTTVHLTGAVELAGRLAGQIEAAASTVVRRMATEFSEQLTERLAPTPPPTSAPTGLLARFVAWFRKLFGRTGASSDG